MKKVISLLFILGLCNGWVYGQEFMMKPSIAASVLDRSSYVMQSIPPPYQLFTNVAGVATAVTSTASTNLGGGGSVPLPILAKCVNAGAIVDCSFSGGGPPTGAAGGDLSGTYPNPGVAQVNGAVVPASAAYVGTNSSRQIVAVAPPAMVNITGVVTVAGCTVSSGQCVVVTPGTTVSFSAIPGTYRALQIRIMAASASALTTNVAMTVNSDSASHYICNFLNVITSVTGGSCGASLTGPGVIGTMPGTAATNDGGYFLLDFDSYANTTFAKQYFIQTYTQGAAGTSTNTWQMGFNSIGWNQTSAVTSLSFSPAAGNFLAGSSFSIYGIQ